MTAAMGIGRFALTPILPFMIEGIPLSPADAGFIASANFLGYLAGAIGASALPSGGDGRRWFLAGLVLSVITVTAMGLSADPVALAVNRFVGGAASALVLVFSASLIVEPLTRAGRPELSAVLFGGVGCGIILSATIVGILGARGADWRMLWEACGAATFVATLVIWYVLPRRESATATPAVARAAASNGSSRWPLIRLNLAYGLFGFGYVITGTFLTTILRGSADLRTLEAPVWALVGLAAAFSLWFWSRVAGRIGHARSFALACLVEAAAVTLTVTSSAPAAFLVAAVMFGGTFVGISGIGLIVMRRISSANPSRAFGVMTAIFGVGQAIGPTVAGIGAELTGSFTLPSLAAAVALTVAAALSYGL
ncbi:YbfB/YjiJ family MFS transporter [Stappia albiluteola]|uniref:YbfB/YjiJ family MFS transporter n=1 Tax=Stappia albiluteola TaxID=2758565 RepID=UPI001AD91397|nr:YbfB/YjiJ family MFS transporter [Stappia albiluteola]